MTGNIRDTHGGIVSEQTARDGRRVVSLAWRSMLRMGVFICVLVLAGSLFAGIAAADPVDIDVEDLDGEGTASDPYIVTNASELQAIQGDLTAHYELGNDINASETENWDGGAGFDPIGTPQNQFSGHFDGAGHTISELYIDRDKPYVGLFGYVSRDGTIEKVGLENVSVEGGFSHVGGLVGRNDGDVSKSYATGSVEGSKYNVGGLVGYSTGFDATVSESYATGSVTGDERVGGLVGQNQVGRVSESYATGSVNGSDDVGGLVGQNRDNGVVEDSYWNTESTEQSSSTGGGEGLTTEEMTGERPIETMDGLSFPGTFVLSEGDYPSLRWETDLGGDGSAAAPFEIQDVYHLQSTTGNLTADYTLSGDIDATDTKDWFEDAGFKPIGSDGEEFTGVFNGSEHTISDLVVNKPNHNDHVGFFGSVGSDGELRDLTLENADVIGNTSTFDYATGTLVGYNAGSIINSSADGQVAASYRTGGLVGFIDSGSMSKSYSTVETEGSTAVGGLVGYSRSSSIERSYATGTVSGSTTHIGGLIGYVVDGSITKSYATGTVEGSTHVGGLIGSADASPTIDENFATGNVEGDNTGGLLARDQHDSVTIANSFWDTDMTGQSTSVGGTGLTTPYMTGDRAEGNMFDFGETWEAGQNDYNEDGLTVFYPVLQNLTQDPAPSANLFDGGNGTEAAPYQVSTWYQLDYVRLSSDSDVVPEDAHFELTVDLDADTFGYKQVGGPAANVDEGFDPIGDSGEEFSGHFNGSGHAISDLYINRSDEDNVGLFGRVNTDGTVEKVGLENASVEGNGDVGGLVGHNDGEIRESYATGSVEGDERVGGLAGTNTGEVNESYATGDVNGGERIGGLVGSNEATVTMGAATGTVTGDTNVGGLVGRNLPGATIQNAYATGNIDGGNYVGGLVGFNDGDVVDTYATGDVDGLDAGGLAGWNSNGDIQRSYAAGHVDGSGTPGGLIGFSSPNGNVADLYWDLDRTGLSEGLGSHADQGVTGLTTEQMQGRSPLDTMSALELSSVWAAADSYPLLTWSISDLDLTLADDSVTAGQSTDATVTLTLVDSTTSTATTTSDYSSDDTGVATVDAWTVTTASAGSATLTAELGKFTDTASIAVSAAPASPGSGGGSSGGSPSRSLELSVTEDRTVEATNGRAGDVVRISPETTGSSDSLGERGSVWSNAISVELATDRDFWMRVDTFERRMTSSGGTDGKADDDDVNEARSAISTAFETETSTLSVGYVTVTHNLEPEDVSSVTFEFSVEKDRLDEDGLTPESITLHRQSDHWASLPTDHLETNDTEVRFEATSPGFSSFAIGTGKPLTRVTEATLAESELIEGEIASVTATVENRGEVTAEHIVELTADGETVATETVGLGPGETDETTLSFEPPVGEYDLAVDGTHVDSLTVTEAPATDPPGDDPAVADDDADESVTSGVGERGPLIWVLLIVLAVATAVAVMLQRKGYRWNGLFSK